MGKSLEQYFKGDHTFLLKLKKDTESMGLLKKNIFPAADRIFCFEVFVKAGSKWHLSYVEAAKAEIDHADEMADFISKRARQMNGAFAATLYTIWRFALIWKRGHNLHRLALFEMQLVFNIIGSLLSWFSLAGFFLTLFIVNEVSGTPPPNTLASGFPFGEATPTFNAVIQVVYVSTIIVQFILAFRKRPRTAWWAYFTSFGVFGIIQIYFVINVIYLIKRVADIRFWAR